MRSPWRLPVKVKDICKILWLGTLTTGGEVVVELSAWHSTTTLVQQLQNELTVFYLDYGILGGSLEEVLQDLNTVEWMTRKLGLQHDQQRCEVNCGDNSTRIAILLTVPGHVVVDRNHATSLGCPIGTASELKWLIPMGKGCTRGNCLPLCCPEHIYWQHLDLRITTEIAERVIIETLYNYWIK